MEKSNTICCIEFTLNFARFGEAKKFLYAGNTTPKLKVNFSRKINDKNEIENINSSILTLNDSLMYFRNEKITFDKIDLNNDLIEISLIILGEITTKMSPLIINLKKLIVGEEKEELWTMPGKSFIDLKYFIKVKENSKEKRKNQTTTTSEKIEREGNIENNIKKVPQNNILEEITSKASELKKKIKFDFKNKFFIGKYSEKDSEIESQSQKNLGSMLINKEALEKNTLFPEKTPNFNIKTNDKTSKNDDENSYEIIQLKRISPEEEGEIKSYDTFCFGVFVSGLSAPIKTNLLIENSNNFMAPCSHKSCSLLPSLHSEVLHKYINKNFTNFSEIGNLLASMCFPLGIKLCYECHFDENKNKINNLQNPQQTFYNIISNGKGELYYVATMQYFIKMNINDFMQKYKFSPLSYYLSKNSQNTSNSKDKTFQKTMQMISQLLNNDTVYIPESISLLSKKPFFLPMGTCLQILLSLQNDEMNSFINHIVNEVPLPRRNKQIQFFIPKMKTPIILNHEYNIYFDIINNIKNENDNIIPTEDDFLNSSKFTTSQISFKILLDNISLDNIVFLFNLILLEQKLIFMDNNYENLSKISYLFSKLIYPLVWTNPFLPILSLKTVDVLQAPVPYIMGLDESLLNYAETSSSIDLGNEIVIFNISTGNFILSRTFKKASKKEIIHEFNLTSLPEKVSDFLKNGIKSIKKEIEKMKKKLIIPTTCSVETQDIINKIEMEKNMKLEEINKKMIELFLKAMIILIGDYNNYTFYTDDEMPSFNREGIIESHKEKDMKNFLSKFVKTQIFNQFLLNELKINSNTDPLSKKNALENLDDIVDTSYFKKMVLKNMNLISTVNTKKRPKSSVKHTTHVKKEKESQNSSVSIPNIIFNKDLHIINDKVNIPNVSRDKMVNSIELSNKIVNEENNHFSLEKIDEGNKHSASNIFDYSKSEIKKILLFPYFLSYYTGIEKYTYKIIENQVISYFIKKGYKIQSEGQIHIFLISKKYDYKFNKIVNREYYQMNFINQKKKYSYVNSSFPKNIISNNCFISADFSAGKDENMVKLGENENKRECSSPIKNLLQKGQVKLKNPKKLNEFKVGLKENDKNESNQNKDLNTNYNYKIINECFKLCCTNKRRITNEEFNSLNNIFINPNNREYFSKLILPELKLKELKNQKLLTAKAFEDFLKMLKVNLEFVTIDEANTARLLTLSCFAYYKIEKDKKIIYIYNEFIEGIYPCKLWTVKEFWEMFFHYELEQKYDKEENLYNKIMLSSERNYSILINNIGEEEKIKSSSGEKEYEIIFETSNFIINIMLKLKLSNKYIIDIFKSLILPKYCSSEDEINKIIENLKI